MRPKLYPHRDSDAAAFDRAAIYLEGGPVGPVSGDNGVALWTPPWRGNWTLRMTTERMDDAVPERPQLDLFMLLYFGVRPDMTKLPPDTHPYSHHYASLMKAGARLSFYYRSTTSPETNRTVACAYFKDGKPGVAVAPLASEVPTFDQRPHVPLRWTITRVGKRLELAEAGHAEPPVTYESPEFGDGCFGFLVTAKSRVLIRDFDISRA